MILRVLQRTIFVEVFSPVEDAVPSYVRLFPLLILNCHFHICRTGFMISQCIHMHGTPHFGGPRSSGCILDFASKHRAFLCKLLTLHYQFMDYRQGGPLNLSLRLRQKCVEPALHTSAYLQLGIVFVFTRVDVQV